ncbi:MAG TPA: ATP-binding protein [Gemmatimonadales bacterium]|nr:ATP-binding protein [Gemmatimonadales bacterium]
MDRARVAEQIAALRSRILGPAQRRGERLTVEELLALRSYRSSLLQRQGDAMPPERVARMRLRREPAPGDDVQQDPSVLLDELRETLEELDTIQQQLKRRNQELAAANQAAEAERRRYRDLFESAPDGYLVTDDRGIIVEANRAATTLLRTPDLAGRPLAGFLAPEASAEFAERLVELRRSGQLDWEARVQPPDGPPFEAAFTATGVVPARGDPGTIRWLLHDTTERKEAERRIRRLNRELERRVADLWALNRELESFSYMVSHDLRSPLRAIEGFSTILAEEHGDRLDDEARQLLDVIRANTRRMGTLIDDLLAFSRLGRQGMSVAEVDMTALAREAFEELTTARERRRVTFVLPPLPPARADRAMMRQVFLNLLSNALKFSDPVAEPRIELSGAEREGELVYGVRDNGVGFDMRYADRLFGVFQRLHPADQFEGTGVGLAIVHRIVQRHGGRLWAEGKVGAGAGFHFTLPASGPGDAPPSREGLE